MPEHKCPAPSCERAVPRSIEHPRWSLRRFPRDAAHRIVKLTEGTVTLVFVGKRRGSWGFYTPDGFVDWTLYDAPGLSPDPFNS